MTPESKEFKRGDSKSENEVNQNSSVLSNGTVVISLAPRYSGTFWYAGGAFGLGPCVELDEPVDRDAPRLRFEMEVAMENDVPKVTFCSGNFSVYKYLPVFCDYWIFALGSKDPTAFVVTDYDPKARSFKLWDPETKYYGAAIQVNGNKWIVALVPNSAGDTFSITYDSAVPATNYTLNLDGDVKRMPQADGVTPHTAVATIQQDGERVSGFSTPATFDLPGNCSATFVAQAGQTSSNHGKTLVAPFDPVAATATAVFVDNRPNGESVPLRAVVDMSEYFVLSVPETLSFAFLKNQNVSLDLSRGPDIEWNEQTEYTVVATTHNPGRIAIDLWDVTFGLLGDSVKFIPTGRDQTVSADGKTLIARLNKGVATARFIRTGGGHGSVVAVTAAIDNNAMYVPSNPRSLVCALDFDPVLRGNTAVPLPADGRTKHAARVTLQGDPPVESMDAVFTLPADRSASFVAADGVSDDGKTLTVPLENGRITALAQFADTHIGGESVTLQAVIKINVDGEVVELPTVPSSLTFAFSPLPLKLTGDQTKRVAADGSSQHLATAAFAPSAADIGTWPVTFTVPQDSHATFKASPGQTLLDSKTLIATLDAKSGYSATAALVDDNVVGNETVNVSARVDAAHITSVPQSLPFTFYGFTLYLESEDETLRYPSDGKTTHTAVAMLERLPGKDPSFPWSVTFLLTAKRSSFVDARGQSLGKSLTLPLERNNEARVEFVDSYSDGEDVTLTATVKNIDNRGEDLPATPPSMMFTFYDVAMGGDYEHPKYFFKEDAVEGDIFILDRRSSGTFGGAENGYYSGAFYVCLKAISKTDQQRTDCYPPAYLAGDTQYWRHAWTGVGEDRSFQVDGDPRARAVSIYGNGRNCVGLSMRFIAIDKRNHDEIIPLHDEYLVAVFAQYASVTHGDGSDLGNGEAWRSQAAPTDYNCCIVDSSAHDASQVGESVADGNDFRQGTVFLLCGKDRDRIDVAGKLILPGGNAEYFGVDAGSETVSVRAHLSRPYHVKDDLLIKGVARPHSGDSGDDDYCNNHSDTNSLPADFYWRQNNYEISIDPAQRTNPPGAPKRIRNFSLIGWGDSDANIGWYCTIVRNYYCTEALILPSFPAKKNVSLWDDCTREITVFDGAGKRDDGTLDALVIVLLTRIQLENSALDMCYGMGPGASIASNGMDFYDQYGNAGHLYFNLNFPESYYPLPGSKRGIAVSNNPPSSFFDIVSDDRSDISKVVVPNCWIGSVNWGTLLSAPWWLNDFVIAWHGDVDTWALYVDTNKSRPKREVPNGRYYVYNTARGGYAGFDVAWQGNTLLKLGWGTATEANAFAFRPLWKNTAFRCFTDAGYIYSDGGAASNEYKFVYFGVPNNGDEDYAWGFASPPSSN